MLFPRTPRSRTARGITTWSCSAVARARRRGAPIIPYLKPESVILWHDFGSAAWRNIPEKHQAVSLDKKTREPTWHGDRLYSKAAARLFDGVEHVDALAVFKVKPAVWQQMRWLE